MIDNSLSTFNKSMDSFLAQRNRELREMFKQYIKPNFLIRVKEEIKATPEFNMLMPTCYRFSFNAVNALGVDDIDFDICLNLAMINRYLLSPLKDEEKAKRYKDDNYAKELKKRTIKQCRLRQLIQNLEERYFLLAHEPLNYFMTCTVNYLLTRIDDHIKNGYKSEVPNANFRINTLIVMLKNIKAILLLTESNNCGSAFSLLRALIESMFVYLAIYDDEIVAKEYYKFMKYRSEYEYSGSYPKEFLDLVPQKVIKQNYLNFGWLDAIEVKKRKYLFSDVLEYNSKVAEKEYNDSFLKAYKYCCKFSHGNFVHQDVTTNSMLWILGKAGSILVNLCRQYSYIFDETVENNGLNLEEELISVVEEASGIFEIKNKY